MKFNKLGFAVATFSLLLACGCGNKTGEIILPSVEEITEAPTEAQKEAVLTGIEQYEYGEKLNENGDASLIGKVAFDAKVDNRYFDFGDISRIDNKIIFTYSLITRGDDYDRFSEVYDFSRDTYEMHLVNLNPSDLSFINDVIAEGKFTYSEHTRNGIWLKNPFEDGTGKLYNSDFEVISDSFYDKLVDGYNSLDNEFFYYLKNGKVNQYSYLHKETTVLDLDIPFYCDSIQGVYTDGMGNDFLEMIGLGGDLKNYIGTFDVTQGKFVAIKSVDEYDSPYIYVQNGAYVSSRVTDNGKTWEITREGMAPVSFTWYEDAYFVDAIVMDNGDVFFCSSHEGVVEFAIFDKDTNLCKACSSVELDGKDMYGMIGNKINPLYLSNGHVLLAFADGLEYYHFYEWNPKKNSDYWDSMSVCNIIIDSQDVATIENLYNPFIFVPGDVSKELKPLVSKKEEIENKYGVKIKIGKECAGFIGGYAVTPLEDFENVKEALEVLDAELAKYPANFLSQVKYDGYDTIDFYVASTLIGMGNGNLDFAGGFQNEIGNEMLVVIDFTNLYGSHSTVHHELSHILDDFVANKRGFDEDKWKSFNSVNSGYADMYTYDYGMFGFGGTEDFVYNYGDADNDDACFVDSYAMTYPTEDRARIWENVMMGEEFLDFTKAPILMEKLNYYVLCIRQTFDTTGWDNVIWEKYLQ